MKKILTNSKNYTAARQPLITLILCLLLAGVCSSISFAGQQEKTLSLREAMTIALSNSLSLDSQRIGVSITEKTAEAAWGIYDPTFTQEVRAAGSTRERASIFEAENVDQELISSSLRQLISTGGYLQVGASFKRTSSDALMNAFDPEYNTGLGSRFTQPLLRGFGKEIVETNITISCLQSNIARTKVISQALDLLAAVERTYWQLAITRERRDVVQGNLELLRQNLDETLTRRNAEVVSDLEVIQARQRVVACESDLVNAEAAIYTLEDQLKKLLVSLDWDTSIKLSDSLSSLEAVEPDFQHAMETARKNRPELAALETEKQIDDVRLRAADNSTRPALDLFAEVNLTGRAGTFQPNFINPAPLGEFDENAADSMINTFTFDNFDWAMGAMFTYTFDNRAANAIVETTKLQEKQRILRERDLLDAIRLQLRQSQRDLQTAKALVQSRTSAAELAQAEYEAENTRLQAGESTTFLTLEALQKLNVARLDLVTAKAQLANAIVDYKRATGTTLSYHNIELSFTSDTEN